MKNGKSNIQYGTIAVLGAATAVIPLTVYNFVEMAGVHMHGMAMKMACETTCVIVTVIGAVITTIAIISLFIKNAKLSVSGSAVLLVGGASVVVVPRISGLCASADMACRYITEPTLTILGSVIIILSIVRLANDVISLRKASIAA